MSELTRAQVEMLVRRAERLIAESQRLRRALEQVLAQADQTKVCDEPKAETSKRRKSPK